MKPGVFAWLLSAQLAIAQSPHLGYLYPAGGRQGTTFQVVAGGQFLNGATNAFISGDGIRASVIEYDRPMSQKEFQDLREELKTLQEKHREANRRNSTNQWTTVDEKRVTEIKTRILKNAPNRQSNPAISETVVFQIFVATNAPLGRHEFRVETGIGLSNPLVFEVGSLPEFTALAAKTENPELDRFKRQLGIEATNAQANSEARITLPSTSNAQIMPGEVDRFRFTARKGQQLVATVNARQLIPYLADAVPGWFQATLALCDARGAELAYNDDFRFHPDPLLHYTIQNDGDYILEVKDAIYRGREDFVYRLSVGELPFITSAFPLGTRLGTSTTVEVYGWNLPTNRVTIPFPSSDSEAVCASIVPISRFFTFASSQPSLIPLFQCSSIPDCVEIEPNNLPETAQKIELPIIINGRISQPGDRDVFRFEGHNGEEIVAEVTARRLDSPLDSVLKLCDATGRQIVFNDDCEDKASGLNTHHADSYLRARLSAGGPYYLHLADVQNNGGEEYSYRLRISHPQPDFALRIVPSSISLRAGMSAPLTIYALRKDGFTNAIEVSIRNAPPGFSLGGARIPANQDQIRITITASAASSDAPMPLAIEGRARASEAELIRRAVPADDMMQAFAYHHLVTADQLLVRTQGRWAGRASPRAIADSPLRISSGGTTRFSVSMPSGLEDKFQFELSEPPDGISISKATPNEHGIEIVLRADAANAKPGLQGNLIVNVFASRPGPVAGRVKGKQQQTQRRTLGCLPAIPFEIIKPQDGTAPLVQVPSPGTGL